MKNKSVYLISFLAVLVLAGMLIFLKKLSDPALITLLVCVTVTTLAFLVAVVFDRRFSVVNQIQEIEQLKSELNKSQMEMEDRWKTALEAKTTPPLPLKPSLEQLVETAMKTKTVKHLEKPRRTEPNKVEELHPAMIALLKERFSSNQPLTEEE
jgi:hypothetical protein